MADLNLNNLLEAFHENFENEVWGSMIVEDEQPYTERVWTNTKLGRLFCHRMRNCTSAPDMNLHPHPWPFETLLVKGSYYSDIGFSEDVEKKPESFMRILNRPGTYYRMDSNVIWHTVEPIGEVITIGLINERFGKLVRTKCVNYPRLTPSGIVQLKNEALKAVQRLQDEMRNSGGG